MRASARLLGSGALYIVATAAPILAVLAVTPVITRLVGPNQYGEIAVAVTTYQLGSVLLSLGLPAAITRSALLEHDGFPGAAGTMFAGAGLAALLTLITASSASVWGPWIFPGVRSQVLTLALVAGCGLAVITMCQAILRAGERVGSFVGIAVLAALLPPSIGLLLCLRSPSSANYATGLAIGYVAVAAGAMLISTRGIKPEFSMRSTAKALKVGLPVLPHLASVPLLLSAALALVVASNGLGFAGQLQVSVILGTSIITILNAANNAWAPLIMKTPPEDRTEVLGDTTTLVAEVTLLMICVFVPLAPTLVRFIGGPLGDLSASRAAVVVVSSGVFQVLYLANIHLTFVSGRTAPLALTSPLGATVALGLLWLYTSSLSGSPFALVLYASTWPVFYVLQALSSRLLAQLSSFEPAPITGALPPLLLALGVCASGIAAGTRIWPAILASVVAILLAVGNRWHRERPTSVAA